MPFDNFFSSKVKQKQFLSESRRMALANERRPNQYYWDKNVQILSRDIGFAGWRRGEILPIKEAREMVRRLQNENPSMEFSWMVAD